MSEISRELRDAIIAFEVAIRAARHLGDKLGRRTERDERVERARAKMIAVILREIEEARR